MKQSLEKLDVQGIVEETVLWVRMRKMAKTAQQKLVRKLSGIRKILDDYSSEKQVIATFLEKYFICEICYKALLLSYRTDTKKSTEQKSLKLDAGEAKRVLNYFKYNIQDTVVDALFSSKSKTGEASHKSLRDKIVHGLNENAIKEVVDRNRELQEHMDEFLLLFKETPETE